MFLLLLQLIYTAETPEQWQPELTQRVDVSAEQEPAGFASRGKGLRLISKQFLNESFCVRWSGPSGSGHILGSFA